MQIDVAVLGTGRMGTRLARMFASAGRNVMLSSRDPNRAAQVVQDLKTDRIVAGTYSEALKRP